MAKMTSKMKKALALAGKKFKSTDAASGGGFVNEAVEDGRFNAHPSSASLEELGGKPAVVIKYEIEDGDETGDKEGSGEEVSTRYFLETEQNLSFLKRDLGRFLEDGAVDDLDLAEDLEATLEAIVEGAPSCVLSVRMAGEYQNVYLNKVDVEGDEDEDAKPAKGKGKKGKPAKDEDEDEENEEDEDEAPAIEKGDSVLFTPPRSKKAKVCKVLKVAGNKATVKDEDGNKHEGILLSKLEAVDPENDDEDEDEDEEETKPAKGGKGGGKGGKKKAAADDEDEDEDEEDEDDETEIDVGSKVTVNIKGKEYKGTVKALDEDEETVSVRYKNAAGEMVLKDFPADKIEAL